MERELTEAEVERLWAEIECGMSAPVILDSPDWVESHKVTQERYEIKQVERFKEGLMTDEKK